MERTSITYADAVDIDGDGQYSVVAATSAGDNFILCHAFESEAAAKATARKVLVARSIDEDRWNFWRATYGSSSYMAEEAEAHMYASAIRLGLCSEDYPLIPDNIRTLL